MCELRRGEERRGKEILKEAALSNRESNLHTLHKRDTNWRRGGERERERGGGHKEGGGGARRSAGKYCNWLLGERREMNSEICCWISRDGYVYLDVDPSVYSFAC